MQRIDNFSGTILKRITLVVGIGKGQLLLPRRMCGTTQKLIVHSNAVLVPNLPLSFRSSETPDQSIKYLSFSTTTVQFVLLVKSASTVQEVNYNNFGIQCNITFRTLQLNPVVFSQNCYLLVAFAQFLNNGQEYWALVKELQIHSPSLIVQCGSQFAQTSLASDLFSNYIQNSRTILL